MVLGILAALLAGGPARGATHAWQTEPEAFQVIDPVVVADRLILYDINLAGFNVFGDRGLSPQGLQEMEDAIRRAFETWNEVIAPIGLAFRETPLGQGAELNVRAVPYDDFDPDPDNSSVAVSLGWPFQRVYAILPIYFDTREHLGVVQGAPVVAENLLSHPYIRIVASDYYDLYEIAIHEIGHTLGLGHVGEAVRGGFNYNLLGLSTVQTDPASLEPSRWVGGMDLERRRPILEIEALSVMVPIRRGTYGQTIPPEDRAAAAFTLRNLNPQGADEVLAAAKALYEQSTPLRFGNVVYENERNGANDRNNTIESAMPIDANQVVIGSLFGQDKDNGPIDADCYRLDLGDAAAETEIVLDIDEAGGLVDSGATKVSLRLLDEQGGLVATGQPVGEPDAGSYSGEDPVLRWRLAEPGVYYILVEQPKEAFPGTYVLKVGVGGPVEPGDARTPAIDTAGSGVPKAMSPSPLSGLCPGVGYSLLAVGIGSLWLTRRSGARREG